MHYTYLVKYDFETEDSAGANCQQFVTVDEPIDTQEKLNELRIPVSTDGVPVNVWVTDIALMNVEQEAPPKHAPGTFVPPLKREFKYAQAVWPCPSKHATEYKVQIGSETFYFETAQDAGLVLGRLSSQFRWARDFKW